MKDKARRLFKSARHFDPQGLADMLTTSIHQEPEPIANIAQLICQLLVGRNRCLLAMLTFQRATKAILVNGQPQRDLLRRGNHYNIWLAIAPREGPVPNTVLNELLRC